LQQVAVRPGRPRHHAEPAAHLPVEAELARERPRPSGTINGNAFHLPYRFHQFTKLPVVARLPGDFKEPHGWRVDWLVKRMAEAGDSLVVGDDLPRIVAPRNGFGQELRAALG